MRCPISRTWLAIVTVGLLVFSVASSRAGAEAPIKKSPAIQAPFILWGGDVATFHANGGLKTQNGAIFDKLGLHVELKRGDDFDKQVDDYLTGKSPFLRGTMSMLAQVTDRLVQDKDKYMPIVFLQMTWSVGDHLVARGNLKTLDDLKGKTIALQKGGPHVGMLHDILNVAQIDRKDITVKWVDDITGAKGPAEAFRKDAKIDACFVITPDMTALTGGLERKGPTGAHVLVSTAHMMRSIADVYACRKDFYDKHRDQVEKFAAGYLKACEELMAMKKKKGNDYKAVLRMTQDIYGKEDLKTLDDASDLIDDATFVGLAGNIAFFTTPGNLSGFEAKRRAAALAVEREAGVRERIALHKADFNYDNLRKLGQLTQKELHKERFANIKSLPTQDTIYSFNIRFQPNQSDFPAAQYGAQFQRALEMASLFGRSVVVVRGHADPAFMLGNFADEGARQRVLRTEVKDGKTLVFMRKEGTLVDLADIKGVLALIDAHDLPLVKRQVENLKKLSEDRSKAVLQSVVSFAKTKEYVLDHSQIRTEAVGVLEPVVSGIRLTDEQSGRNRRVEFRVIRIPLKEFPEGEDGFDR